MILRRLFLLFFLFISFTAQSQVFPNLDSLRKYINIYIRNSAVESFTNLRLNRSLNGLVDFIDATTSSANINNTSVGNGIKVAVDGSRQIKSMTAGYGLLVDSSVFNQVNYRADTATLYGDIRKIRKVDTLFAVNDTLLRGTINGDTFNITIKGVAGLGNTNAGAGYKLAYPGSDSIKSLRAGYGINLDSATIGEVKITSDSATIYSYIRNNLRKVDSIYAFNDTTIKAVIMGTTYSLVIKGAAGAGNQSLGSGYKVAINGTYNIKSLTSGFGVLLDSASTNQVNVKADTSALYSSFRGIINSSTAITSLTGDVTGTGPGATATTISNSAVTNAKLRNSAAYSVIGRKDTTSGVVADISATAYGQVLKRDSSGLTWAYLDSTSIPQFYSKTYYDNWYLKINAAKNYIKNAGAGVNLTFISGDTTKVKALQGGGSLTITRNVDSSLTLTSLAVTSFSGDVNSSGTLPALAATIGQNAVSNQKFRQSAAFAVVGNSTNATANVQDITAASNGLVLRRASDTLKFGLLDSTSIPALHSEAYYNGKYLVGSAIKNYVQNVGTGNDLSYKLVDSVKIKRVQAGTGIGIAKNVDSSLTISTTAVLPSSVKTYIQNVGSGSQLTYQLADSVKVKRLQAGSNVTFTQNTDSSITINSTQPTVPLVKSFIQNVGSGVEISYQLADSVKLKRIQSGTGISIVRNVDSSLNISTNAVLPSSVKSYTQNVGIGTQLTYQLVDSVKVKRVQAGTGITVATNTDSSVTVSSTAVLPSAVKSYVQNIGTGTQLTYQLADSVKVKRLQAGTNVTLTQNADSSISISSAGGSGTVTLTGAVTGSGSGTIATSFGAGAALSVLGNATSVSAVPTYVASSADFQVLKRSGTSLIWGTLDSNNVPVLHSESYYNTKYDPLNSTKNFIKNAGAGVQLSYQQVDTVRIKRLQAGTGVTLTPNADSSLTVASSITQGYTSLGGDVTVTGFPAGTVAINANAVTNSDLRKSAGLSVIGNATSTLADVADITAAADYQVLKRSGTSLVFGSLDSTNIPTLHSEGYYNGKYITPLGVDDRVKNVGSGVELSFNRNDSVNIKRVQAGGLTTITRNTDSSLTISSTGDGTGITSLIGDVSSTGTPTATTTIGANKVLSSMLRQSPAFSVMGNNGIALANVTDIAAATDGHVLKRLSTGLAFGTLDSVSVPALRSEGYYNGKYLGINNVKNYIKNGATTGSALSYQQVDTTRIKRIIAGTNTTITNNPDSSITIAATGDGVGATGFTGDVVSSGNLPTLTATFRQGTGYSVLGRSVSTAGAIADISTTTTGAVLRMNNAALGFGLLDSVSVPALRSEGYYNAKYLGINNTKNYIKNTATGVNLTYQQVDTVRVKGLQAGTLVTLVRNTDSSLTINASGDGTGITQLQGDVSTPSGSGLVTATIGANKVLSSMLRQSPAFSVMGNSGTALANVTDIAASTDGHVLKRLSTGLAFGQLDSTSIPTLRSEGYYNTKYLGINNVKNYIKNGATSGSTLSYQQADTTRIKRIIAGTNTTVTNNADSSITIAATGDGVGATGFTGDVNSSGSLPTLTATIATGAVTNTKIGANAVTNDKFRQSAGLSVVGNSTSVTANVADITAGLDFQVLKRSGTSLVFGTIDSLNAPTLRSEGYYNTKYLGINNTKNYVKNGNTSGVDISYLQADTVRLKRLVAGSGTTITRNTDSSLTIATTATVPTFSLTQDVTGTYNSSTNSVASTIAANVVSDSKLRQGAAYSVIGRSSGTGGNVADISTVTNGHALRLYGGTLGFGFLDSISVPALHSEGYYNGKYLPGGATTQIQYNNSGVLGGDAGLTYNATTNTVLTDTVVGLKFRTYANSTAGSKIIMTPFYSQSRPNAGIWLDETITNGDTNTVITLGHNWDYSKATDGGVRIGLEQKYPPVVGATYRYKEAHLPEVRLKDGTIYRPASWDGRDDIKDGRWTWRADKYNFLTASDSSIIVLDQQNFTLYGIDQGQFRMINRAAPSNVFAISLDKTAAYTLLATNFANGFATNSKINIGGAITNTNNYGSSVALGNTVIENSGSPYLKFAPANATTYSGGINASSLNYLSLGLNAPQVFGRTASAEGSSILFDSRGTLAPLRFEVVNTAGTAYYSGMGNNGKWQFGTTASAPAVGAYFDYTDAIRLPLGTSAQRPTGAAGYLRYNSDLTALEYHNGTAWGSLLAGSLIKNYIKNTSGGVNMTYQQADTVRVKSLVAGPNATITRNNADSSLTINAIPSGISQTIQYNNAGSFGSIPNMTLSDNILGGKDVEMYNGLLRYGSSDSRTDLATPPSNLIVSDNFYLKRYYYPLQQGTYVPTILSNSGNAISPSFSSAYYTRTGNTVEVWGSYTASHTTLNASTQVTISLPFAVTSMAVNQLVGNGFAAASTIFLPIIGETTFLGALFTYLAPTTLTRVYQYHFRYYLTGGGA